MKKKILITGGSGLLAVNWALSVSNVYKVTLLLHRKIINLSGVDAVAHSTSSLDNCLSVLEKYQPDFVIHTAGLTNVEECESNPDLAKDTVAVVFFKDKGLKKSQQMFSDLNRHAIRPSTSIAKPNLLGNSGSSARRSVSSSARRAARPSVDRSGAQMMLRRASSSGVSSSSSSTSNSSRTA